MRLRSMACDAFQGMIVSLVFVGASLPPSEARARKYNAFMDVNALGYDAVKATIGVVPTTLVDHVSIWCGIDDGRPVEPGMWIQHGWIRYSADANPRFYYEYKNENGIKVIIPYGTAFTTEFEVVRESGLVSIKSGGLVQNVLFWSDFDHHKMCKAQYGAEIHADPGDHCPGTSSVSCDFTGVSVRAIGSGYSTASLQYNIYQNHPQLFPTCADYWGLFGSFSIWDLRALNVTSCP